MDPSGCPFRARPRSRRGGPGSALACPGKLYIQVEGRLPHPVEVSAYYIVCEALTNVAEHAEASAVKVSVERLGDTLDLSIQDNGVEAPAPAARA